MTLVTLIGGTYMAVRLELYRVFLEVAKQGNISAAAQNLFISQSAVSQSVKQL